MRHPVGRPIKMGARSRRVRVLCRLELRRGGRWPQRGRPRVL